MNWKVLPNKSELKFKITQNFMLWQSEQNLQFTKFTTAFRAGPKVYNLNLKEQYYFRSRILLGREDLSFLTSYQLHRVECYTTRYDLNLCNSWLLLLFIEQIQITSESQNKTEHCHSNNYELKTQWWIQPKLDKNQ